MTEAEYKEKIARLEGVIKKQEEAAASAKSMTSSTKKYYDENKDKLIGN